MTVYNSHIQNLRIVIEPAKPVYEGGLRVGDKAGAYAQFEGGRFQTDDKKIIEKLESLPTFGIDFHRASDKKEKDEENTDETQQNAPNLEKLTKPELVQIAQEKGLEVNPNATKKELLKLLESK